MKIKTIQADWVADSELNQTVAVRIITDQGEYSGAAPQGTSDGQYEAQPVSVDDAVKNIQNIIPEILTFNPSDLNYLDDYLIEIGGENMGKFGANASVALSSAWAKMAATANNMTAEHYLAHLLGTKPRMPVPAFNIINGGLHGAVDEHGRPYNPIQELMLVPYNANSFEQAYLMAMNIFKSLRELSGETLVGKEGGFSPARSLIQSIHLVALAIGKAGYKKTDFRLAIDAAASEFYQFGSYSPAVGDNPRDVTGMIEFYRKLVRDSPIQVMSIEDPLAEHDFEGFAQMNRELEDVLLIGDDLYVTQKKRVQQGVEKGSTGGVLIKVNQNGTVTGTLETIRYGLDNGLVHMVSHRSKRAPGDLLNAYLAVAVGQMIKHGSSRGERVEMYNELLRIERDSGLPYAGLT